MSSISHFRDMHNFYDKFTFWLTKNCESRERIEGFKFKKTYNECNEYIVKILKLKNNKNITFFDLGCGIGKPTLDIAKKFPKSRFYLVNSNKNHIKYISKKILPNCFLINQDYHTLKQKNIADVVIFSESYSHSYNRDKLVSMLTKLLKPGGLVLIIDWFLGDIYTPDQLKAFVSTMRMYLEKPLCRKERFEKAGFKTLVEKINTKNYLKVKNKKYADNYFYYKDGNVSDFGEMVYDIVKSKADISIPAIYLFKYSPTN